MDVGSSARPAHTRGRDDDRVWHLGDVRREISYVPEAFEHGAEDFGIDAAYHVHFGRELLRHSYHLAKPIFQCLWP